MKYNYIYGLGKKLARKDGSGTVNYLHSYYLGSLRVTTNSGGTAIWNRNFYPFGEEMYAYSTGNEYKFTGKEWDEESDLYYSWHRYYRSEWGRFTQVDPLWMKYPSLTSYQYCDNNPLKYVDKDGKNPGLAIPLILCPDPVTTAIGIGMLAVSGAVMYINHTKSNSSVNYTQNKMDHASNKNNQPSNKPPRKDPIGKQIVQTLKKGASIATATSIGDVISDMTPSARIIGGVGVLSEIISQSAQAIINRRQSETNTQTNENNNTPVILPTTDTEPETKIPEKEKDNARKQSE